MKFTFVFIYIYSSQPEFRNIVNETEEFCFSTGIQLQQIFKFIEFCVPFCTYYKQFATII